MISYKPLWKTMSKNKATTYTLRNKHGICNSTVQRLQKDLPVSTYTLDRLCKIFNCPLGKVAIYIPDKIEDDSNNMAK